MAKIATINIHTDPETKSSAEKLFSSFGTPPLTRLASDLCQR